MARFFTVLGLTIILLFCVITEEDAFYRVSSSPVSKNWSTFDLHVREFLLFYSALVTSLYLPEIVAYRKRVLKRRSRRKMEAGEATVPRGFTVIMSTGENGARRIPHRVAGPLRWVPPPRRKGDAGEAVEQLGDVESSEPPLRLIDANNDPARPTHDPSP